MAEKEKPITEEIKDPKPLEIRCEKTAENNRGNGPEV